MNFRSSKRQVIFLSFSVLVILGYLLPQNITMPVAGGGRSDYNQQSFWYYPWGKSITHKGVDIFAKQGTDIRSSVKGLVVYAGNINVGGNVVIVLGPKWRFHYYAHLDEIKTSMLSPVSNNTVIGTVGTSGNATGKSPHLHYSIFTPLPYFWRADSGRQGWLKMFFLNPVKYLNKENR